MKNSKTLFFVYNANSGMLNLAFDSIHKLLSPTTYSCYLCSITHGYFGEVKAWKTFINQSDLSIEYYHKDEWKTAFPEVKEQLKNQYPVIYIRNYGHIEVLLSAEDIKGMDIEDLIMFLNHI